jgi:hypothetical protein
VLWTGQFSRWRLSCRHSRAQIRDLLLKPLNSQSDTDTWVIIEGSLEGFGVAADAAQSFLHVPHNFSFSEGG